jgi:hypothetical protein
MKKKLTPIPPTASVKVIPGTKYVLIDGDKLALLQTPIVRTEQVFYLIGLKGNSKPKEIDVEELKTIAK